MNPPRIAVVHHDAAAARQVEGALGGQGYRLTRYATLGRFFDAIAKLRPDLALLGMQLPGMEGHELLRTLRANSQTRRLLLIGLSDRTRNNEEAVAAFSAGADEYFFRPWDRELLVVRVRSLIVRRDLPPPEEVLQHSGITVEPERRLCQVRERRVRLTRLEFDLLVLLMRNPERVLTRGHLIDNLWRSDAFRGERVVDRHMHALRAKLGASGAVIQTVVGVGYRLSGESLNGSSK